MKIKIISDGTSMGTSVINADTGEAISGVVGVTWECPLRGGSIVTLALKNVPIEASGMLVTEANLNDSLPIGNDTR